MQHPQRAHHVLHLGHGEQPAQADHLDRDAAGLQRVPHRHELRPLAAQHRDVRRPYRGLAAVRPGCPIGRAAGRPGQERGGPGGHPLGLVEDRVQQGAGYRAPCGPVRGGGQPGDVGRLVPQFLLDGGGRVEHLRGVAEAGGQLQHRGRPGGGRGAERADPGHHGEVGGEPAQVAGAGAAPAVDGLARVADRGHRVPAAEQRPQQHQLGVAGVLVLVEQDDLVAGALGRSDLRVPAGDPGRQCHLVPVVEYLARRLGRRVPADQRQELLPGALGADYLPNGRRYTPRQRVLLGGEPETDGGDVTGVAQVLGQVAGQVQHGRGDRLGGPGDLVHRAVVGGHDLRGELPGQCGGDQPHGRLEALPQGVVPDQAARVGVIGADHRVPAERVLGVRPVRTGQLGVRAAQPLQPGAHPVGELGRGLPGEGEAEYPVRADHPVGDQPDQSRRHRFALARARARDDRQRAGRRGDHRGLLRRRLGQPEQPGQLRRTDRAGRGHHNIPAEGTDIPRRNPRAGSVVYPGGRIRAERAYDVAYAKALEHVLGRQDAPPPILDEAREALAALTG